MPFILPCLNDPIQILHDQLRRRKDIHRGKEEGQCITPKDEKLYCSGNKLAGSACWMPSEASDTPPITL